MNALKELTKNNIELVIRRNDNSFVYEINESTLAFCESVKCDC